MTKAQSWIRCPYFLGLLDFIEQGFTRGHCGTSGTLLARAGAKAPSDREEGQGLRAPVSRPLTTKYLWTWGPLHTALAVNRHLFRTLMPDASLPIERDARTRAARAVGGLPRGARGLREGHRLSFVRAGRPPPEVWRCPFVRNTAPCMSEPEVPGYQVGNEQQVDTGGPDGRCKGADSEYARSPISR